MGLELRRPRRLDVLSCTRTNLASASFFSNAVAASRPGISVPVGAEEKLRSERRDPFLKIKTGFPDTPIPAPAAGPEATSPARFSDQKIKRIALFTFPGP
jgi:hypothetical protein